MTPAQYEKLRRYCAKVWQSRGGGLRDDLQDDFFHSVIVAILAGDADDATLSDVVKSTIRDLRRDEDRHVECIVQAAFESGPLPARVEVPFKRWGGPRANSGGARQGAGRPRKAA